MATQWSIDEGQSDVLIKMKDATITYQGGLSNHFNGFVSFDDDQVQDAALEFNLDTNSYISQRISHPQNHGYIIDENKKPFIRFKSTSFQKIENNIHFLKGYLTIKNITKVVELDAEFIGFNTINGSKKAAFEIKGDINRTDFSLDKNFNVSSDKYSFGKSLKLVANLEFSI
jgi:polyisoprenoid-binding protein YceI